MLQQGGRDFNQPFPQHRMVVVGASFLYAVKAVIFSGTASTETFQFRENVPDPVGLLKPVFDFAQGLRVITRLGVEETLEVEKGIYSLVNLKSLPSLEVVIKEVPSNSLISILLVSPLS